MRAKLVLIASSVLMATRVFAASAETTAPQYPTDDMVPQFEVSDFYDAKAASDVLAKWSSGERKIASTQAFSENNMSPSMKKVRDSLLASKTANDFDQRIKELDANYDKLDDDAKFFAAQLIAMKPLRGIVWRLRPLFEKKSGIFGAFSGNAATHSSAVSMLRFVDSATKVYVPTSQADALFDFAVAPNADMTLAQQFKTVGEFQLYLAREVLPALMLATTRINPLFKSSSKMPLVWDNKINYGTASFKDGMNRYVGFNEPEVAFTQAALLRSMQGIAIFDAYNQDQIMNVAGKIGQLYGIDGYASSNLGVTSAERTKILNSFRGSGFLALRTPKFMGAAYKFLTGATVWSVKGTELLQAQPATTNMVLNPLFFKPDAQPRLAHGLANLQTTVSKRTPVRNQLTGETVDVDVPGFYANPPKSLLDLLPTAFESTANHELTVKNKTGEALVYRDYSEGRATNWNLQAWKTLFPSLKSGASVDDAFRTVQYSGAPNFIVGGMSGFIF